MSEEKKIEFEQYKIFIDSAEKNSDKRITQNNIYLTINLAFVSYICTQNFGIGKGQSFWISWNLDKPSILTATLQH